MHTKTPLPKRPVVLSIAGFDPSAGAGLLADIKTFESLKTYGLGVQTALTVQTDTAFQSCCWTDEKQLIAQLETLLKRFSVAAVKIGIVENWEQLLKLVVMLHKYSNKIPIVWDPVLQASTGFPFHAKEDKLWVECLKKITVLTPNWDEVQALLGTDFEAQIAEITQHCAVYLKGGHRLERKGEDILYLKKGRQFVYKPHCRECSPKHGSGCVLSSALAAYLALGFPLYKAVFRAKRYAERFLQSNPSLLGYHKI